MRPSVLLSVISLLLVSLGASAQSDEDATRRWAVDAQIGGNITPGASSSLQVEYGYRFGVDSPYRACYTEKGSSRTSEYHGQMHRHVFSVGLKVTFPFRWTNSDWSGLLDGLLDNL